MSKARPGSLKEAASHERLAEILEHLGDFKRAFEHLKVSQRLKEALWSEASSRKLRELEALLRLEQARREAQLLKEEHAKLERAYEELSAAHRALQQADQHKAALLAKLERLSFEDPLTGLYNRRYLDQMLSQEFQKARTHNLPLSVALSDLDGFKKINDRFSHAIGDQTLRLVGQILKEHCRQSDLVARYGGEEFALIFPETTLEEAEEICERLRQAVESYPWFQIHPELQVTLSFGLCSDLSLAHHERLLSRADDYLYEAKRQGKNRVFSSLQLGSAGLGAGSPE